MWGARPQPTLARQQLLHELQQLALQNDLPCHQVRLLGGHPRKEPRYGLPQRGLPRDPQQRRHPALLRPLPQPLALLLRRHHPAWLLR